MKRFLIHYLRVLCRNDRDIHGDFHYGWFPVCCCSGKKHLLLLYHAIIIMSLINSKVDNFVPLRGLRIIPLVISKQRVIQFNSSCGVFLMKLVPKQGSHMWELQRNEINPFCNQIRVKFLHARITLYLLFLNLYLNWDGWD